MLVGGGVRLRPLTEQDRDEVAAAMGDPGIWAGHPARDRWKPEVIAAWFADAIDSGGALVIEDAATGEVIGSSRFDPRRAGPGEVEIGWTFLVRSRWGGGTNLAVKRLMVQHALAAVDRVVFLVAGSNARSQAAMTKIGGRRTDRTVADLDDVVVFVVGPPEVAAGPLGVTGDT